MADKLPTAMTNDISAVWSTYDRRRTDGTWPEEQVRQYLAKIEAEEAAKRAREGQKKGGDGRKK